MTTHQKSSVILSAAQHSRRTCIPPPARPWVRHVSLFKLGFFAFLLTATIHAQPTPQTLKARLTEVLAREASGHSPTSDELLTAQSLDPVPPPAELADALPTLLKALESPDTPVRTYALSTLVALQVQPTPESPAGPSSVPSAYKPAIAQLLAPAIPQIAKHLTEEAQENRLLTANVLGGFTPDTPPTAFPALYEFLRRDRAIGTTGTAVVNALLGLGPLSPATSEAIARYLRRSDQTPDSRANLADLVASSHNQSPALNKALTSYLESDDQALRARIILSLPQLDLTPDAFADLHARIAGLAENTSENLQVITAAKAIAPCWTAPHPTTPCPTYPAQ